MQLYDAPSPDLQLRAWRALLRSHATILRALDAELTARTALSIRAYEVLVRLAAAPDSSLRMSELAASVLLSPSGISRLVDQLVERRLVRRRQDPADARAFFAELTPEGRSAFEKARRVYARSVREHFGSRLTPAQLRNIAEALEVFLPESRQPGAQ